MERTFPYRLALKNRQTNKQNPTTSELLQKETVLGNVKARVSDPREPSTSEKMRQLETQKQPKLARKWSLQLAAKLRDIYISSCHATPVLSNKNK